MLEHIWQHLDLHQTTPDVSAYTIAGHLFQHQLLNDRQHTLSENQIIMSAVPSQSAQYLHCPVEILMMALSGVWLMPVISKPEAAVSIDKNSNMHVIDQMPHLLN